MLTYTQFILIILIIILAYISGIFTAINYKEDKTQC